MSGFTVPSIMEQRMLATRQTLSQLNDKNKWSEREGHRLGDGLVIKQDGTVEIQKRATAPSQGEQEDMMYMHSKFMEWLKAEGAGEAVKAQMAINNARYVENVNDPVISPQPLSSPSDLSYEFGTPIDTTEIMALCEETSMLAALPEVINGSKIDSWREMTSLINSSGTMWLGFTAGSCPDQMLEETGEPKTITKKHLGKMASLTESDIQHSIASIAAGYGVKELVGPANYNGQPSIFREAIRSLQDKYTKLLTILVMNGVDSKIVKGDASSYPLEFNGFENYITSANGARVNVAQATYSGTFSATHFDEWLAAGCAKPTHLFGHPTTLQQVSLGYWGLGCSSGCGAQTLNFNGPGAAIVPGLSWAQTIQTGVGSITLVPNSRFTRTNLGGGQFSADIFAVRMNHNGEPLIYRSTQIPMAYKELTPGCSAISFEVWTVTALVVKWMCAQGRYTAAFSGLVQNGCDYVFGS